MVDLGGRLPSVLHELSSLFAALLPELHWPPLPARSACADLTLDPARAFEESVARAHPFPHMATASALISAGSVTVVVFPLAALRLLDAQAGAVLPRRRQ